MGAALVGGTLASIPGIAWAAPPPRPNGRKCKSNSQCASENCAGGVCRAPGECASGDIVCPSSGVCVNPNCSNGLSYNPLSCRCETPTGVTITCVCRSSEGAFSYPTSCYQNNLQCPDPNTTDLEDRC